MPKKLLLLILFFLLLGCSVGESDGRRTDGTSLDDVLTRFNEYSNSGKYTCFINEALPLYRQAVKDGDRKKQLLLGCGIAYMYARMDEGDSVVWYLERLIPMAEKMKDRESLVMLYNTYGLYSTSYSVNYDDAIKYFRKALDNIRHPHRNNNYSRIINNLSHTYNLCSDTSGLKYSLEVYETGLRNKDEFLIYIGSANTATQYCLREDWEKAYGYICTAMELADKFYNKVEVYSTYSNVLYHLGRKEEAERYFRKAMEIPGETEAAVMCGLYCNYGYFLLDEGKYREAEEMFRRGIDLSLKAKSYMHRHNLYLGLSKVCEKFGDTEGELDNFKKFHYLSDSLFNAEKERSFNELKVKYRTEQVQHRLQMSYIIISVLVVAFAVALLLYILKRKRYKERVSQHYENFRREHARKEPKDDDRMSELYGKIEELMNTEQLWRKNDISVELLARHLNSNRSYISSAINKYAGVAFKQYINNFRISEAVSMLSDPQDSTPLKAMYAKLGYNSSSSFYRSFQTATGVPPSQYRREIRNIKQKELSHNDKI